MIKKLTLVVGFGAGYVLGAKAGKDRYKQITKQVNGLLGRPEVQDVTHNLSNAVTEKAGQVKDTAKAKVEDLTSNDDGPTDKGSDATKDASKNPSTAGGSVGSGSGTSPSLASGPIPGAASSDTV